MKEWNIIDLDVFVNCFTHIICCQDDIGNIFNALICPSALPANWILLLILLFCLTA